MKNKKGFTITELLIVIGIIAVLATIVTPLVSKYLKMGKEKYYESLGNELIVSAKDYYTDNAYELPNGHLNDDGNPVYYKVLTLDELKKGNYITNDVVDTNKNSCEKSYITTENINGDYIHKACLICNDKLVYGNECPLDFEIKDDNQNPVCEITYGNYTLGNWTNKDVTLTVTGTDYYGISYFKINDKKIASTNGKASINVNKTSSYIIYVYDKAGNRGECATTDEIKIDKEDPMCDWTSLVESTTWTNGNKTISVSCQDTGGSACQNLSNLSTTYTSTMKTAKFTKTIKDNAGNETICEKNVNIYIDKEKPVIAKNGNLSSNFINSKKTLTIPLKITEKYSGINPGDFTASDILIKVGGTTISPTTKNLVYNSVSNGVYSYTLTLAGVSGNGALTLEIPAGSISDKATNKNVKTTITSGVTIDNTSPTCKYKGESTTWTNGNRTISVDCQDTGGSACQNLSNLSATYTSTMKTAKFTKTIKDNAGNETICEKTANIYIDKEKPVIAKNGNSSNTAVNASSSFTMPLKITEKHSGINTGDFTASDITVKVGGTAITPTTKTLTYKSVSSGVYSYTLTLAGVSGNGALTLEIPANAVKDKAGNNNTATTLNYSITVDTTPPSAWVNISGTAYGSGYRSGATASVGCSDTNGISGTWIADNTGDGNANSISLISRSCSRSVTVTCVDTFGNSSSSTRTVPIYASVATGKYSCNCKCWYAGYAGTINRSSSNTSASSCNAFCNSSIGCPNGKCYGAHSGSCTKKYTTSC